MLYSPKNSGVFVARNVGLERAHGDWIAFIDSDDYIAPDYLERFYAIAKSGAAYDERVKTYVPGIIIHRYTYLERTGLMADAEMHRFYLQESVGLMLSCLFKYFLCREWDVSVLERKKGTEKFFSDEIFRGVLDNCTRMRFKADGGQPEIPFRQRIALLLLQHGRVGVLLVLNKVRRIINSVLEKRDVKK